jgi:hypothetical protein
MKKVMMLEELKNNDFTFKKGEQYKCKIGDEIGVKELEGKILVRQPNSPKGKDLWCVFDKESLGELIAII